MADGRDIGAGFRRGRANEGWQPRALKRRRIMCGLFRLQRERGGRGRGPLKGFLSEREERTGKAVPASLSRFERSCSRLSDSRDIYYSRWKRSGLPSDRGQSWSSNGRYGNRRSSQESRTGMHACVCVCEFAFFDHRREESLRTSRISRIARVGDSRSSDLAKLCRLGLFICI